MLSFLKLKLHVNVPVIWLVSKKEQIAGTCTRTIIDLVYEVIILQEFKLKGGKGDLML